jgi:hypothetical protein
MPAVSRGPVIFGLLVALVGVAFVYVAVPREFEDLCGIMPVERSSESIEWSLWPPGTFRCEYTAPSGAVTERKPFPWFDLLVVLGVAVGAAIAATAFTRVRRPALRLLGGVTLALGSMLAWFLV